MVVVVLLLTAWRWDHSPAYKNQGCHQGLQDGQCSAVGELFSLQTRGPSHRTRGSSTSHNERRYVDGRVGGAHTTILLDGHVGTTVPPVPPPGPKSSATKSSVPPPPKSSATKSSVTSVTKSERSLKLRMCQTAGTSEFSGITLPPSNIESGIGA